MPSPLLIFQVMIFKMVDQKIFNSLVSRELRPPQVSNLEEFRIQVKISLILLLDDKNDQVLRQGIYNTIFAYGGNTDYTAKYHGANRGNYVWSLIADCPSPSVLLNNLCTVV